MNYPVMEAFYTLQGEGVHNGKPAFFIRLAGCDVGCSWCDVKESWNAADYNEVADDELVNKALDSGTDLVVITGGEPLMYDMASLTKKLQLVGLKTHIETAGVYPLTGTWNWVCVSPKKFKKVLPEVLACANELKVIIVTRDDLSWSAKFADKLNPDCQLLIQPEWSKREKVTPMMIDFVKDNPQWRISLQQHKYLNIP